MAVFLFYVNEICYLYKNLQHKRHKQNNGPDQLATGDDLQF